MCKKVFGNISTLKYGADNNLIGHAFLAKLYGNTIATIMLDEDIKRAKDFIEIGIGAEEYYRIKDSEKDLDE